MGTAALNVELSRYLRFSNKRLKQADATTKLREIVENHFQKSCAYDVIYMQWVQTDRCSLEKQQSALHRKTKEDLDQHTLLVVADFSENHTFALQDSAQGIHWNNENIHPLAWYMKDKSGETRPLNLVVISDRLKHSTAAVHAFQSELVEYLKQEVPDLTEIVYFSDGAASQLNRYNVLNTLLRERDFGVSAE